MLPVTTHDDYLVHLLTQLDRLPHLRPLLRAYVLPLVILVTLSLDAVRESLAALYCPTGQGNPYDPAAMLRSWLLMTLERVTSPDAWATRLRREPLLALLAGFVPGRTPCATAHRDFLTRFADGPYAIRKQQDTPLSQTLRGRHEHRLHDATDARRHQAQPYHTQSEAVVTTLLDQAETPRDPHALQTRLDDLFVALGLRPTLEAGLLPDALNLTVGGDGTTLASAASGDGRKLCDCPPHSDCDHPRSYTSATAQFCKDAHHDGYTFGDRSYTLVTHAPGLDLPLITIMGAGNESDFTLAPKALDELLKLVREHNLPLAVTIFVGDGHHDALAIYLYLQDKGIIPIIPLAEPSAPPDNAATPEPPTSVPATDSPTTPDPPTPVPATDPTTTTPNPPASTHATPEPPTPTPAPATDMPTTPDPPTPAPDAPPDPATSSAQPLHPHVDRYPDITFDPDGTPLCPGGRRMRHFQAVPAKRAHYFICPAQHGARDGYHLHPEECPFGQDCCPDKRLGYTLYIASAANPRLFPPIPRDSQRFKDLYHERTSTERSNAVEDSYHLDHAHYNAVYGLIRLTFVNICKHARARWHAQRATHSEQALLRQALQMIGMPPELAEQPN